MATNMKVPPSQSAVDLGLGNLLTQNLQDEEEKRKAMLQQGMQDPSMQSGAGIMSPATLALFGPKRKLGSL